MKQLRFAAPFVVALAYAPTALATTWYVSPTGTATSGCPSRETPCDLGSAAYSAVAGDTVVLMDGVYETALWVTNSGTETDWITFRADDCATPIIQGPGPAPGDDDQSSGVGSAEAEYIRFRGIVSRGWNMGFANAWTGNHTPDSNGHWDIEHCIAESNGRTGFTFFSAEGARLKNSISAHNGSSTLHSWSSGVTLYAAPGGVVEGCVSFENTDAQKHTDGSGFIVDETTENASFINNIAFRNGGSCLRLTKSSGTTFINNTCYQNAQDAEATGPTDPSEIYFTNAANSNTTTNVNFMNNVLVNTGQGAGVEAVVGQPDVGWSNNVVMQAPVDFFAAPEGDPPDFTLAKSSTELIGQGGTDARIPTGDIGFDPKCLAKGAPELVGETGGASWWQNSIDFEYIKSIGGVAACFNAQARTGAPDVGAYAAGEVTVVPPGECVPAPVVVEVDESAGAGSDVATAGAGSDVATAGAGSAGDTNAANTGGLSAAGAETTSGDGMAGGSAVSAGAGDGTPAPAEAGSGAPLGSVDAADDGCTCTVPGRRTSSPSSSGPWLLGLAFAAFGRRHMLRRQR